MSTGRNGGVSARRRAGAVGGLTVALGILGGAHPAVALGPGEGAAQIARLEIALWPEYDKPAVLVTCTAQLAVGTTLPARVILPMPAAVGEPHAVAKRGLDGQLYNADFRRTVAADTAQIEITSDQLAVHLEYYAALTTDGERRSYAFRWPGGPAIGELVYVVQQPAGATELVTQPPASESRVESRTGLTYHTYRAGPVAAGGERTFSFSYQKSSAALTISTLQPSPPSVQPATPRPSMPQPPVPPVTLSPPPATGPTGGMDDSSWFDAIVIAFIVGAVALAIVRSRGSRRR